MCFFWVTCSSLWDKSNMRNSTETSLACCLRKNPAGLWEGDHPASFHRSMALLIGAFYAGNGGMIPVITSNVIIPATSSNPSIPYVKRTSKSWMFPEGGLERGCDHNWIKSMKWTSPGWWFENICFFPFSWECHNPNWRTPSFFRGVGIPPARFISRFHDILKFIFYISILGMS